MNPATTGAASRPGRLAGLGIDSVDVVRFAAVLARRPAIVDRLFTEGEKQYASTLRDPAPSLAARFAAKEATMKALGVGLGAFKWTDLEVVRAPTGAPSLHLSGRAAKLAEERGVDGWHVSLTHTAIVASAVVGAVIS